MTIKGFFGGLLLTVGILGAILTGGCSLLFGFELRNGGNEYVNFITIGIFGLIPFLFFLGMTFLGHFLFKRR